MTYDQYWYGDPLMVRAFFKADRLRQERMNAEAWLNGLYTSQALMSTVGNMFNDKNADPFEYPSEPIQLFEDKAKPKPASEDDADAVFARAWMMSFVRAGKDWGKGGGDNAGRND